MKNLVDYADAWAKHDSELCAGAMFAEEDQLRGEIAKLKAKDEILIKGQSLSEWQRWCEVELMPPNDMGVRVTYVVEALLELINKVK